MPTPAEDEAARLKQQEADAAERQRQVIAETLRDGMAKDQMQAPARPASPQLAEQEARQRDAAQREKILEAAKANNHPQVRLNDAMAAAVKAAPDERSKEEAAKQEALKQEALKQEALKREQQQRQVSTQAQEQPKGLTLAQLRAQEGQAQTERAVEQRERDLQRFAQLRANQSPARAQPEREGTDRRRLSELREAQQPAREETEKRQSLINSGKPKDKEQER